MFKICQPMQDILPGRLLLRSRAGARFVMAAHTIVHLHASTTREAPYSVPAVNFKH